MYASSRQCSRQFVNCSCIQLLEKRITADNSFWQVLRWSALGFGVFYGAYHQLSLSARDKANASKKDWEHKESLIKKAKAEWARSHPEPKASGMAPHHV